MDLQEEDLEIKKIISGDGPKNTSFDYVELDQRKVFCENSSASTWPYVPEQLRKQIIQSLHSLDHIGISPSIKRIANEYYWPSLKHDVKDYVKKCVPCCKTKQGTKLVNTGAFRVPDKRFSHVMVDVVGPLPASYRNRFLLAAICRTTHFLQAIPLSEASASATSTAFLNHWVSLFGMPSLVTSDNGGSFTAGLWKGMMEKLDIEVKYSALYRPQSIGLLERQHRSIKTSLKAAIEDMAKKHQEIG